MPATEPPDPDERIDVGEIMRRHPESVPPPDPLPPFPRWKAFVDFGFLLLVALGGLTLSLWFALGSAIVGMGLGGERIHVVDVQTQSRGSDVGRIDAPPALAGRSISVDGIHDGTYYRWPAGSGEAFSRGWGFLAADWIPLTGVVLCLIAVSVIVRVLWKLIRHPDEEV